MGQRKREKVSLLGLRDVIKTLCNRVQFEALFACFGAASPRTLSSGRKGTMLASRVGFHGIMASKKVAGVLCSFGFNKVPG